MRKLIMLLAAGLLASCASLTEGNTDAQLVVQYATLKTCDTPERATRCAEIAAEVARYANDTEYLTVALLMTAITDEIDWQSLDTADTLLIQTLLNRLQAELVARLGTEALPEDVRLATTTVARWVIYAAALVH